jgi:hypothetical protein
MAEVYKRITVMIPDSLYTQAKQLCLDHRIMGGLSGLIRRGLEAEVMALDKVPLKFSTVFHRHAGRAPTLEERYACYGARHFEDRMVMHLAHAHFTVSELLQHFSRDLWNERTAVLVAEQEAYWRSQGAKYWKALLRPPGWTPAYEAAPVEQVFEPLE